MAFHATHFGAAPVRDPFAGIALPPFLRGPHRPLCADHDDPELWFENISEEAYKTRSRQGLLPEAVKVCMRCPLIQPCQRGKTGRARVEVTVTGYTCPCDLDGWRTAQGLELPSTRPAVVLDPFGGTGTTALVAHALGRIGLTVDMSGDYSRLARWRTTDRGELAKAMRVEKPKPVPEGQMEMFA